MAQKATEFFPKTHKQDNSKSGKLSESSFKPEEIKGKFERLQELYSLATTEQQKKADFLIELLSNELGLNVEKEAVQFEIFESFTLPNGKVIPFPSTSRNTINPPINAEHCISFITADNSLIEKGIDKGDFVIFDTNQIVVNGDIAIIENLELVLQNNNDLIMRIVKFLGGGRVELESANPKFKSIKTELSKIRLLGRLVRVERDF